MEIRDGGNFIQIEVVDIVPRHRSPGDMEWSIAILSARFQGQAFAWIYGMQMKAFLEELRKLEATRQGSATLTGMSPDDFQLRLFSIDRWGHMAVGGRLVSGNREENLMPPNAIDFAFRFDAGILLNILNDFISLKAPEHFLH